MSDDQRRDAEHNEGACSPVISCAFDKWLTGHGYVAREKAMELPEHTDSPMTSVCYARAARHKFVFHGSCGTAGRDCSVIVTI